MQDMIGQGEQNVKIYHDGDFRDVVSAKEAAKMLHLEPAYVRQLCDMGKLIATKYNGRWWVFEQAYKESYVHIVPF